MPEGYVLDKPFSFVCPDCGGVVRPEKVGSIRRFRCHIGHVLTAETMLVAQFTSLEVKLGGCLALLNERAELCQQMAEDTRLQGGRAGAFEAAAREALARAETLKKLLEDEWVQPLGYDGAGATS
jgi:two-component system chemotaxis response regulator CheB